MGNFEILTCGDAYEWNQYLDNLPLEKQDIYYTPEYYRLYESYDNSKAYCFVFKEKSNIALYPFLMNSVNKLGYNLDKSYFDIQGAYGYNGVISSTNDYEFIKDFYVAFTQYCRSENIIAEFTRFHPLLNNQFFSENHLQIIKDRKTVYLSLENNFENIFNNFQTTTRKQIKRARNRYGIEVVIMQDSINEVDSFYKIYFESMQRVNSNKYLFFNKDYFTSLFKIRNSVCFFAYYQSKPIACIYAFHNNYFMNGHLGGSLTEYQSMSPISLLYNEMIKFGISIKCKYLHVGGGSTNDINNSLLAYKLNFSKTTSDFYIGKKIYNKSIFNEVTRQWVEKHPDKNELYKNVLLKYRNT